MQLTVIGIVEIADQTQLKIVSEILTNKGKQKLVIHSAGNSDYTVGKLVEYTGTLLYLDNPINEKGEICVYSQLESISICESELEPCCTAIGEITVSGALDKNSSNKYETTSEFTFINPDNRKYVMKIKFISDKKELKLKKDTKVNAYGKLMYQYSESYNGFILYGNGRLVEKIKVNEVNLDSRKICFRRATR